MNCKILTPLFVTLFLVFSFSAHSSSDKSADQVLKNFVQSLPEKSLTLDLIMAGALKSDSFKSAKAESYRVPIAKLKAESAFDTKVKVEQNWFKDESEPGNGFSPDFKEGQNTSLTVSRYFSTGTAFEVSVKQDYNDINIPSLVPPLDPYYESGAKVSLSQNLWADSFGMASRRGLQSAELASQAQRYGFTTTIENWFVDIANQFYLTWLSQAQAQAAHEGLKRRERLLSSARVQLKRGTTETPDYLQIEAAYLLAKTKTQEAQSGLEDQWRRLLVLLKLPADLTVIDPLKIPITIDNTVGESTQICRQFRQNGVPNSDPAYLLQAKKSFESAENNLDRARSLARPDLKLVGSYMLNGVNGDQGDSVTETIDRDHPGWIVGLSFSMPLGFSEQKADVAAATAEKLKAEAVFSGAKDDRNLAWLKECDNLERLIVAVADATKAFENQKRRADLEEKRYRLGRVSTFNVIQAGDDATDAEINLNSTQIQIRQVAWRIMGLNSQIIPKLESYAKKYSGNLKLE